MTKMTSYQDIQSFYHREKKTPVLQRLPDNYYTEVGQLLSQVEERHSAHIKKLMEELVERRQQKILMHALRVRSLDSPPENIQPEEELLFNEVVGALAHHTRTTLELASTAKSSQKPKKEKTRTRTITLLKPIPKIVGADSKEYGPYAEGDTVMLPEENAKILIKQDMAEENTDTPS